MPPVALTVALPVAAPKQFTLACALMLLPSAAAGCVIVTVRVAEQPLASVMVQVHEPAARPEAVAPLCAGTVFQEKE